ncbi:sigma-70 family RNA polymerase sigma factor [Bacillaceae bacterium IKA-2]|nr:sigma-70 family RNA polymerase sigma factor [Bacillaceae bacterium IKA-2]
MTWEDLYVTYSDRIYNYIYLMVGNKEVALDLTQDTFVRVKDSLKRFRGDSNYYTWLISISRNIIYDYWRRKKKIQWLPLFSSKYEVNFETPEEIYEKSEGNQELYRAIKKLKLTYQEVLILRFAQELTTEETATALGWSISKVKSTTQRAKKALKIEIELYIKEGECSEERR